MMASALIGLLALGEWSTLPADDPGERFKANTFWQGTCAYDQADPVAASKPFPMILFVKQRKGASFEGVTWYPTHENGLLRVSGRVGVKGELTFVEEDVLHGKATPKQNTGVVAGMKFTGRLQSGTIRGTGEWTGPAFNGSSRVTFSLKRTE
jgi:hypothetical protein